MPRCNRTTQTSSQLNRASVAVRGMRITVDDILEYLASGMPEAEVLVDLPYLTREDIKACRSFAADRKTRVKGRPFHEGC